MKSKICFVGQFPPPMHGLAKAIETLYNSKLKEKYSFSKINITDNKKFLKSCWKILRSDCDIYYFVLSQSKFGNLRDLVYMTLMMRKHKKVVVHIHGGYFGELCNDHLPKWQVAWNKKLLSKVSCAIALGESLRWMYKGLVSDDKIAVVPNCVDDQYLIDDVEDKLRKIEKKDRLEVIYLSNMIRSKGYRYVLEVIKALKVIGREKDFYFHFAGKYYDKAEEQFFNMYVEQNELQSMVEYHGVVYGDEKNHLLRNSDIFMLPTTYQLEGQPISILEAMGNGISIITTNHAGISDIASCENGFVVDKNDIDVSSIVGYICRCYDDRKSLVETCRKNNEIVKKYFTECIYVNNMDLCFQYALSNALGGARTKVYKNELIKRECYETIRLSYFDGSDFDKGAGKLKIALWYIVNALIVRASWNPFIGIKVVLLKAFGAKIGKGLVIKNNVIIKSPWYLTIGDDCWLGEGCWIDNLDRVIIGSNVCISQGAMLLTGNHDYTNPTMPYRNAPISIEDGAWIGAQTVVCPGVTMHRNAILTVGSIATKDMEANGIYQGNPAVKVRKRIIKN